MEVSIFPKKHVATELKKYVELRLHTDVGERAKELKALQQKLTGSLSLPIYVIVNADRPDEVLDTFVGLDISGGTKFAEFLRSNLPAGKGAEGRPGD